MVDKVLVIIVCLIMVWSLLAGYQFFWIIQQLVWLYEWLTKFDDYSLVDTVVGDCSLVTIVWWKHFDDYSLMDKLW